MDNVVPGMAFSEQWPVWLFLYHWLFYNDSAILIECDWRAGGLSFPQLRRAARPYDPYRVNHRQVSYAKVLDRIGRRLITPLQLMFGVERLATRVNPQLRANTLKITTLSD